MLVDDVALIGSSNWTTNSTKAEELSCIIRVTPEGKLHLLRKFLLWRSMSVQYSAEHFAAASAARGYPVSAGAVAAERTAPARERANSVPANAGSPAKDVDLTSQCLQEVQDGTATNYILKERQARKKREALEVAMSKQQPTPLTEQEAKNELENEARRVESLQMTEQILRQNDQAPHMSV